MKRIIKSIAACALLLNLACGGSNQEEQPAEEPVMEEIPAPEQEEINEEAPQKVETVTPVQEKTASQPVAKMESKAVSSNAPAQAQKAERVVPANNSDGAVQTKSESSEGAAVQKVQQVQKVERVAGGATKEAKAAQSE